MYGRHARQSNRAGEACARCAGEQRSSLRQRAVRACFRSRSGSYHEADDSFQRRMENAYRGPTPSRSRLTTRAHHRTNLALTALACLAQPARQTRTITLHKNSPALSLGTNNVDCCARVCHAPSAAAMKSMLGTGAATNSFDDIEQARAFLSAERTRRKIIRSLARASNRRRCGEQVVCHRSREIELARYADIHLARGRAQTSPLLNAMACAIVEERLFDESA